MFEYHNNQLCIVAEVLYSDLSLLTYNAYMHKCKRSSLKRERTARPGQKALVNYNLLPADWKVIIQNTYGDPYTQVRNDKFTDHLVTDIAAITFYRDYTYGEKELHLSEEKQIEYSWNAAILNTCKTLINNRKAYCKAIGGWSRKPWEPLATAVSNLDKTLYPHSLPKNYRSLQRAYQKYNAGGYHALIHSGFGNSNSEKINPNAQIWVLSRWSDQIRRCATVNQLFVEYNAIAVEKGWKQLEDAKSLHEFLHREEIQGLWWGHRYGELKAKEKFSYQHSTKLPTMRDSLWYSDGTKVNYFYQDEKGNVRTTSVYEIMDAYSEVLLGYHFSDTEDYAAQYSAYKMAAQVAGHRPYQIGFDNQGGHKKLVASSFLSKVAHLAIRTQPYNGKSKTIENAFARFQSQFLKQDWFFTGQNIQSKKQESKANMEFINANKANLPTLQQIKDTYKMRRDQWNNDEHPFSEMTRMQAYLSSSNPETPVIEMWDMVDIFWMVRPEPVTYNAYGLTFKEKGTKYTYSVYNTDGSPNIEWHAKNIDKKFFVKFDPEDLGTVLLYDTDANGALRFVTEAKTKIEIARGKQEQTAEDAQWIATIKKLNETARIERHTAMEEILEQHGASAQQQGFNTAPLLGINSKRKKAKKEKKDFGQLQKVESEIVPQVGADNDESYDIYDRM